jgi:hypothetical protein
MTSTAIGSDKAAGATVLARYRDAVSVLSELPTEHSAYRLLSESDLLEVNGLYAEGQRMMRGGGALIAGEIAHRSAPELGSRGLAQRSGHRSPEQFIKITTGATGRDAVTAVRVGSLMREAAVAGEVDPLTGAIATMSRPWLEPVSTALASRSISVEAAEAIRSGLGSPDSSVTVAQLADAAAQLCSVAGKLDPDALGREARNFRDELDLDGVGLRAEERRQKRSLRVFVQADGMTKLVWMMDTETAATVRDLYDRATSPKLGGVHFVNGEQRALADSILRDERTSEQLASDGFEELLRLGADSDPRFLLGSGAPVVRITATATTVTARRGLVRVEGQQAPLPMNDLERLRCGGASTHVVFDETGTVLDLGREQRFFTKRQKEALALTWGGCAVDGCDRPPSGCEAHHIVFWARDGGKTDLADGILLCRHHHLLFHNNGWEIVRDPDSRYWLIPPRERDPDRKPIELTKKGVALRDLGRERTAG